MKPLPIDLRRRFEALAAWRQNKSFLQRLFVPDEILAHIREIRRSQSPLAIRGLMDNADEGPEDLRRAVREAIHHMIATMTPENFSAFDQFLRSGSYYYDCSWWNLKPSHLSRFAAGPHAVAMLGIFSCHSNGYVREEAVKQLAAIQSGEEFGFLFLRLNDWVGAVRNHAVAAVNERVRPGNLALIQFLPLIVRGEKWQRGEARQITHSILQLLGSAENDLLLRRGLATLNPRVSRACARVVVGMEAGRSASLLQYALKSLDPWVRFRAAERWLELATEAQLGERCAPLLKDRAVPIRRFALERLAERTPGQAGAALRAALLDRSRAMRESANFYLRTQENFDSRAFYREALAAETEANRASALLGLGEYGKAEDVELVRPDLQAKNVSVRKAALVAGARLAAAGVMPELLASLQDESPGISRIAARALAPHVAEIALSVFDALLVPEQREHVRKNAIVLGLQITGKWERLAFALKYCGDLQPPISSLAHAAVGAWIHRYNRSAVAPTKDQLEEVTQALEAAKTYFSDWRGQELRALFAESAAPR